MKILSFVILFSLCSCGTLSTGLGRADLRGIRGGQPDPKTSSDREEREMIYGVFGKIVTMEYQISENKKEDTCINCDAKTTLIASDFKINGRADIYGSIPVCNHEGCLKTWVEKFVGFNIDKMKKSN